MLLAQCKLFYVKENVILGKCYTGKIVTFLGVCFNRLCFKLNNLTSHKFSMSELKLSWVVTLTSDPSTVISHPAIYIA